MRRLVKDRRIARVAAGATAALLGVAAAGSLAAQTAGTVGARRIVGDTVMFRAVGVGKMDTILILSRALDREQYGSQAWLDLSRRLDSLMSVAPMHMVTIRRTAGAGGNAAAVPRGWLGFNAQGPSREIFDADGEDHVTYFAYPSILSVDPRSPADRAGIVPGDLVIAFNGTDVVGREFNLTRLMVPDAKVAVTIRRDGEVKDYSLDVVRAPEGVYDRRLAFTRVQGMGFPPGTLGEAFVRVEAGRGDGDTRALAPTARGSVRMAPRGGGGGVVAGPARAGSFMVIAPHAVFGADVSTVGADLARVLKLERGVLVNDVPESSAAYKSGLRAGDVIVAASGQPIATVVQLQDIIVSHFGERSVPIEVMRDRRPARLTVTW